MSTPTPDPTQPVRSKPLTQPPLPPIPAIASDAAVSHALRPDLPDWGAYMRPPEDGVAWIHPQDIEIAQALIPSARVFRRSQWDGEHYWLHYGEITLRVRPTLWILTPPVDLDVGEQVELLSRYGANDAGIYHIADILFNARQNQIEFHLRRDDLVIGRPFVREDLRQLHEQHELRAGFYRHELPKAVLPDNIDLLDVGDLLSE